MQCRTFGWASPHYGERAAQHWLDVVRYAETEGFEYDRLLDGAWRYRDYVIDAFNADVPYDRFVTEQLAGDEMVRPPYAELPREDIARLIATGFLRMAPDGTGGGADNLELAKNDVVAETVKIVTSSLLGMTVGCAQCHDHRYDPIPQSDYYRFRAVFEPALDWKAWRAPNSRRVSLYTEADKARAAEIEAQAKALEADRTARQNEFIQATFELELAKLPEDIREAARKARDTAEKERNADQKELLKTYPSLNVSAGSLYLYDRKAADELKKMADEAAALRATKPVEEFVRALTEVPGKVPKTYLFHRGDHEQPKQELAPASLTVLASSSESAQLPVDDESVPTTGRRLALAKQLTEGTHPLLTRVLVNRIWMHHFGRGLVATPSDFGVLGDRPSHPELLDWLASELVRSGWSMKHMHRLIMTSTAYRQSAQADPAVTAADPDHRLLGQFALRRLEAESLRDAMLAVAGRLNDRRSGPPVPVMADLVGQFVIGKENLDAGRPGAVIPMQGEEFRRTVYVQWRRSRPLTVLDTFDLPRMEPNCEVRNSSTVATQSLLLINSDFVIHTARSLAERVREEAGTNTGEQVRHAWRLTFARDPSAVEVEEALSYLDAQTAYFVAHPAPKEKDQHPAAEVVALSSLCQMLLSSNEFLYVD